MVCGATLATSAPRVMLSAQNDTIRVHGSVTTVPAMGLISKPANLLDLEGTTVTFTPDGADAYTVAVGPLTLGGPGRRPGTSLQRAGAEATESFR